MATPEPCFLSIHPISESRLKRSPDRYTSAKPWEVRCESSSILWKRA
jgi:hypothetical protein